MSKTFLMMTMYVIRLVDVNFEWKQLHSTPIVFIHSLSSVPIRLFHVRPGLMGLASYLYAIYDGDYLSYRHHQASCSLVSVASSDYDQHINC